MLGISGSFQYVELKTIQRGTSNMLADWRKGPASPAHSRHSINAPCTEL